ncbi:MAG: hypothetical protein Roseis2KO_08220 [Roseivirga sp.]
MRAIIADDEPHIHQTLKTLITHLDLGVDVIEHSFGVKEAYMAIIEKNPDLVFLDIQMGDGSGFDLLDKLPAPLPQVIFVTAHHQYALDAFKYSALDYLIKPVNSKRLKQSILKAMKQEEFFDLKKQIQVLSGYLESGRTKNHRKVVFKEAERIRIVHVNDVLWCRAQGSYTQLLLKGSKELVVSKNLGLCQQLLDGDNFYRLHRSYLINCDHIVEYNRSDGSILFTGNLPLPISVNREQLQEITNRL